MRGRKVWLRRGSLIVAFALATVTSAWADVPIEISACQGAQVPAHRVGVLTSDLHCDYHCVRNRTVSCAPSDDSCPTDPTDDCEPDFIRLGRGATLQLQGHTIFGAYNSDTIRCLDTKPGGTCTVAGPGGVASTKGSAVFSPSMNVRVRDLDMNGSYGAIYGLGSVDVRGCTFGDWDGDVSGRRIRVLDSTSLGEEGGFDASDSILLMRVTTASGIRAGKRISGRGVTLAGNAFQCGYLDAPKVQVSDVVNACPP
jgi:hypothetical protein